MRNPFPSFSDPSQRVVGHETQRRALSIIGTASAGSVRVMAARRSYAGKRRVIPFPLCFPTYQMTSPSVRMAQTPCNLLGSVPKHGTLTSPPELGRPNPRASQPFLAWLPFHQHLHVKNIFGASLRWVVLGRKWSTKAVAISSRCAWSGGNLNNIRCNAHLGSCISRVVLGEEYFTESSSPKQLVRNPHLVLGDFDLVNLALPPCSASLRQRFRLGQGDRPLAIGQSKGSIPQA